MANNIEKQLKEISERLEQGVKEIFTSERYTEYLNTMSKFHNYSFNNTLLITMQKPEATLVVGYQAWQKKFNRHVKRGEKGIQIIAPAPIREKQEIEKIDPVTKEPVIGDDGQPETEIVEMVIPRFRVTTVFDVSQTEGEPIADLEVPELTGSVQFYDTFMQALQNISPVPICMMNVEGDAKGYYHQTEKYIAIKEDMSNVQTMKTGVHEVSHALLHDREVMDVEGVLKDQTTKEVEAESIAYIVCNHFGLDTSEYSFTYIASWCESRDMKALKASMDTIRKTSAEIIGNIEEQMHEIEMERPIRETFHREDVILYLSGSMGSEYSYNLVENMTAEQVQENVREYVTLLEQKELSEDEILKNERMDDMECVKVDYKEFEAMTIQHSKDLLQAGELRATSEIGRDEVALNGLSRAEVEQGVLYHAQGILEEMGLENEVELLAARVHGSRSREELYRDDSDLDVVLSYRGNIREDSFFNELNAHGIAMAGIKVDINPIAEERITLAEYMKESEAYLDQKEIEKLAVDLDNFSYEYDTYEYKDTVENREEQVEKITEDILNQKTECLKDWLVEVSEESDIDSDVITARSLLFCLEKAETLSIFTRQPEQEQPEATITFYVAECMEFPVMGEYHNNLTLEEAIKIYESIPADRLHGGKGIGFDLQDGDKDYSGEYELMCWDRVDRELIDMIPHYKESPLVQKAINDMEKYLNEKHGKVQEAEQTVEVKQEVPEASVKKESVSVEPNREQNKAPAKGEKGELKKSVLQSLKEFQARAKAQEQKNKEAEKSKAHKKGDVEL